MVKNLGSVRLYREDMEDIARALSELGPITVTCDEVFSANAPDDFAQLPDRPRRLEVKAQAEGHSLVVAFTGTAAVATMIDPTTVSRGILYRIAEICSRPGRRRLPLRFRYGISMGVPAVGLIALVVGAYLRSIGLAPPEWATAYVSYAASAVTVILIFVNGIQMRKGRMAVDLINKYKSDRPSFWRRTQDDWVVQIVAGLLLALLGFVLGKIT